MAKQEFTSEKTTRKQITALHKKLVERAYVKAGDRILDYGGGKWDLGIEYFAEHDIDSKVFDPYNRTLPENFAACKWAAEKGPTGVLLANVLNVIKEAEVRADVVRDVSFFEVPIYVIVHPGDNDGIGKPSRDGWQEHRELKSYIPEIQEALGDDWTIEHLYGFLSLRP
tara:strand:- start:1304 stop:1810 length:507 start_codon:yes stop_codon:yes gene_type:complete